MPGPPVIVLARRARLNVGPVPTSSNHSPAVVWPTRRRHFFRPYSFPKLSTDFAQVPPRFGALTLLEGGRMVGGAPFTMRGKPDGEKGEGNIEQAMSGVQNGSGFDGGNVPRLRGGFR